MRLIQYFKIYGVQLKNNFVREAVYRTNFLAAVTVDAIWIMIELSLFSILYANTKNLAGWRQEQVYFFLGIFFTSDALFTVFFGRNFWNFSDLVNRGELDTLLTKPVSTLFLILSRFINLTAGFNILLGLVVIIRYAKPAGFEGGYHWLVLFFWLLVGLLTAILLRFLFSICVFWTDRGTAFSRLYFQFFAFGTKPDTMYPKTIRFLIRTALPFAFIGSVPARALLYGLEGKEYFCVFSVLSGFLLLDAFLWRAGLRRYQSASS